MTSPRVRVHTGTAAEQSARDMSAHAYTVGHNIVFGADKFVFRGHMRDCGSIAHELTHVVQKHREGIFVDAYYPTYTLG